MTKERIRHRGIKLLESWRADWNKFVREAFDVYLDKEQQEILSSVQHNPRTSVASGTARGKDFVAACAAISFMYLTPRFNKQKQLIENTKVALTAPTDRQVKNIMMPEISRLFNRAKRKGIQLTGRLNAYDIRTDFDEWFLTGFKADENNHEAWSGFHAVNTMFVVTEASGVSDNVFDAIEGNLQGNSRILIVFNPNKSVGYAAKSQKSNRWSRYQLNSLTAPNVKEKKVIIPGQVDYDWVVGKIADWTQPIRKDEFDITQDDFEFEGKYYRPEDLFRKKVLGKFPKISDDVLIPQAWIDLAHDRWKEGQAVKFDHTMPTILGVDVAGMGRDATVYVERTGNWVQPIMSHNSGGTADHMQVAGQINTFMRGNPNMYASIDTIGEGAGVYSRVCELQDKDRVISCKYSEKASQGDKTLKDYTGQYQFANMRAYLFWAVRDWLDPKNETGAMLPPDDFLDEEATEIRWEFKSDGKIIIEPKEDIKKRLGRSTDRFDALANTFYPVRRKNNIDLRRIHSLIQ